MKVFLKMAALCISLFVFMLSTVFAADSSIEIKREENADKEIVQKLIVTGSAGIYAKGAPITLKVFSSGKNEADMELKDYALFDQTAVNSDGSFSFEKLFSPEPGDYKVVVTSPDGVMSSDKIYYPALDSILELIEALNGKAVTAAEAAVRVETDNRNLVFDDEIFRLLSASAKIKVFENMMSEISFFDINNIYECFDKNTLINALNGNIGIVQKALGHYEKNYLKLKEASVYKLFDSLSGSRKNEVYSFLEKQDFKSIPEIKDGFFEAVILTAYKNVTSYLGLYDILEDYQNELNCTFQIAGLKADSRTKNGVLRYLITEKNKVNSIESLISKLDYAIQNIDAILKSQTSENGGNGGNSGNHGSGSTIKTEPPVNGDKPIVNINTGFTDLGNVKWAEEAIMTLYHRNIINGKNDGIFAPDDSITRAEFVKILTGALEIYNEAAVCVFSDTKNHWAYHYIASAYSKGYIMGQTEELFGVDSSITREDTAVILYRILQVNANSIKVTNPEINYSDMGKISDYAVRSVKMLSEYGMIKGFEDNTFRPGVSLTRAEAAVLVNTFLSFMNQ